MLLFVIYPICLAQSPESKLQDRLAYLRDIEEVTWVEFDDNNVYIGFNSRPPDLSIIMNAAAIHGNRAYGHGVHLWAVPANLPGWRPGKGPYYCTATARYGKIEHNDCK